MNILFIEDEKELAQTAVAQFELRGYKVYSAYDLAAAREVINDPGKRVDLIIADHRLADGFGIQFIIEIKEVFPLDKCVIVSGCLTARDIEKLEKHALRYFHKPLLYGKMVDELRRTLSMKAAQVKLDPAAALDGPTAAEPEPTEVIAPEPEAKKKMRFGFPWKRNSKNK